MQQVGKHPAFATKRKLLLYVDVIPHFVFGTRLSSEATAKPERTLGLVICLSSSKPMPPVVAKRGIRDQVTELGAYRMLVEQAHDLISAHTADDRALFLYASGAFNRLLGIDPQVRR